jgi:hypothetical protein
MNIQQIANKIKQISLEDALRDYDKLCLATLDTKPLSIVGNTAIDFHFFKHRLMIRTRRGIDFITFLRQFKYLDRGFLQVYAYALTKERRTVIDAAYRSFKLYCGTIQLFKPLIARQLYLKYRPTNILDMCAGFGGRALAAMSLNIPYIGFDTNRDLEESYVAMTSIFPHTSPVEIHYVDSASVDYSQFDYDFCFTSPPYYAKGRLIETYQNMPNYQSYSHFIETFLRPMISNSFNMLKEGGTYCLNIPVDMIDDVVEILQRQPDDKFLLPKQERPSKHRKEEFIYIWKKNG